MTNALTVSQVPDDLSGLQQVLEAERDRARARLDDLAADLAAANFNVDVEVTFDDEDAEGGTAVLERERLLALRAAERRHVADLEDALARFHAGTYGRCERCGAPIPPERLEAIPNARACVACLTRSPLARSGRTA